MADIAEVEIRFKPTGLDDITGKVLGLQGHAAAAASGGGFSKLQASIVTTYAALEMAKRGFDLLADPVRRVVESANEADAVLAQVNATLRASSQYTDEYSARLVDMASGFERLTTVQDETVLGIESQLIAFGATEQMLPRITAAVLDLSQGMGKDGAAGAALLMGKALQGEFGTLSRYGIIVSETLSPAQKLESALAQIEQRFGGSAAAMAGTFGGAAQQAANQWGNLQEELGKIITQSPTLIAGAKSAAEVFRHGAEAVAEWTTENRDWLESRFSDGLRDAADIGRNQLLPALHDVADILKTINDVGATGPLIGFLAAGRPGAAAVAGYQVGAAANEAWSNNSEGLLSDSALRKLNTTPGLREYLQGEHERQASAMGPNEGPREMVGPPPPTFAETQARNIAKQLAQDDRDHATFRAANAPAYAEADVTRMQALVALDGQRLGLAKEQFASESTLTDLLAQQTADQLKLLDLQEAETRSNIERIRATAEEAAHNGNIAAQEKARADMAGFSADLAAKEVERKGVMIGQEQILIGIKRAALQEELTGLEAARTQYGTVSAWEQVRLEQASLYGASLAEQLSIAREIDVIRGHMLDEEMASLQVQIASGNASEKQRALDRARLADLAQQKDMIGFTGEEARKLDEAFQPVAQTMSSIGSTLTDSLNEGFKNGEFAAGKFFDSVIDQIRRLVIEEMAVKPLMKTLTGEMRDTANNNGGGMGGLIGGVMSGIGGAFGSLFSFDEGGPVPRDMVAQVHAGEYVLPKSAVDQMRAPSMPVAGPTSPSPAVTNQAVTNHNVTVPVTIAVSSMDPGTATQAILRDMPLIKGEIIRAINRGEALATAVGRK